MVWLAGSDYRVVEVAICDLGQLDRQGGGGGDEAVLGWKHLFCDPKTGEPTKSFHLVEDP